MTLYRCVTPGQEPRHYEIQTVFVQRWISQMEESAKNAENFSAMPHTDLNFPSAQNVPLCTPLRNFAVVAHTKFEPALGICNENSSSAPKPEEILQPLDTTNNFAATSLPQSNQVERMGTESGNSNLSAKSNGSISGIKTEPTSLPILESATSLKSNVTCPGVTSKRKIEKFSSTAPISVKKKETTIDHVLLPKNLPRPSTMQSDGIPLSPRELAELAVIRINRLRRIRTEYEKRRRKRQLRLTPEREAQMIEECKQIAEIEKMRNMQRHLGPTHAPSSR